MSLKSALLAAARRLGSLPFLGKVLYLPGVRRRVHQVPGLNRLYGTGWDHLHPFDAENGTDTSGYVPPEQLPDSSFSPARHSGYSGSQPSIVRAVLTELGPLHDYSFVDLGTGKARPILIASEFPFRQLVGVEFSAPLVEVANRNLQRMRERFPNRAPAQVEYGDAALFCFPAGNLVVYLYNPFGDEIIQRVVANIEQAIEEGRQVFVVYYNPVYGARFDASPKLRRFLARMAPYADDELGFGPDVEDPVVVWSGGMQVTPRPGANAKIILTKPKERCKVA